MTSIAVLASGIAVKTHHDRCMERSQLYFIGAQRYGMYHEITGSLMCCDGSLGGWALLGHGLEFLEPSRDKFRDLAERCERLSTECERIARNPFAPTPAEIRPEELGDPDWMW